MSFYLTVTSEKRRSGINKKPIIADGEHEAIISRDLWEKVQKLYSQRSNKPNRIYSGSYPLTGLLKCPACGSSMVAGRVKKKHKNGSFTIHRYYHCGTWRNKGTAACRSNGIKADFVEQVVFSKIRDSLLNENTLKDIVKKMNDSRRNTLKPIEEQLSVLERHYKELGVKKNKIFELYEEGLIDKFNFSERLKIISQDLETNYRNKELLQDKLKLNNADPIEFKVVQKLMKNFNEIINNADYNRKKTILNLVVERININADKQVSSIILHFNGKAKSFILDGSEGESSDEDSPFLNFSLTL